MFWMAEGSAGFDAQGFTAWEERSGVWEDRFGYEQMRQIIQKAWVYTRVCVWVGNMCLRICVCVFGLYDSLSNVMNYEHENTWEKLCLSTQCLGILHDIQQGHKWDTTWELGVPKTSWRGLCGIKRIFMSLCLFFLHNKLQISQTVTSSHIEKHLKCTIIIQTHCHLVKYPFHVCSYTCTVHLYIVSYVSH